MDKIERVTRAFKGEEVDHIPVCLWKHIPPTLWKDELFIKAQMDFYKETDVDFIKLSADKYFCWPAPVLKDIQSAKQLYDIKPLGAHHPHIRGQINRTKKIMEEINGECLAFYLIFCPLSYLRLEIGYPKMMQFMEEDPEAVLYAENVIAQDVKVLVKGIIEEAKVAGIFYSVQNAEENRFTYETYRKYITPPEKEVLDYANTLSDMNVLHCCGWEGIPNRLEDWADYKTAVVSWARYIEGLDVKEAKEKEYNRLIQEDAKEEKKNLSSPVSELNELLPKTNSISRTVFNKKNKYAIHYYEVEKNEYFDYIKKIKEKGFDSIDPNSPEKSFLGVNNDNILVNIHYDATNKTLDLDIRRQ